MRREENEGDESMVLTYARFAAMLAAISLLVACSSENDRAIESRPESIHEESCKPAAEDRTGEEVTIPEKEPDVIYMATPQDVVDRMLQLAGVTKDDVVYDLGCGDGRVVVTAARRFGCRAIGYDIDPERVKESRENVRRNGVQHLVRIEQKDIFTLDLSAASVVFLYLLPDLNVKLIPQLQKLRPGSRIVSHEFDMEGIRPDSVKYVTSTDDDSEHDMYLWTTPLKRETEYWTETETTGDPGRQE